MRRVSATTEHELPPKGATALQWNLQSLFLLTAAVAVWTGYFCYDQSLPNLKQQLREMQQMTTELVVVDTHQIVFKRQPQPQRDHQRWDIYVPHDGYVIRLATREVGEEGVAPARGETCIGRGRHRIDLHEYDRGGGREIELRVDDKATFKANEQGTWNPGFGAREYWSGFDHQPAPDVPCVLLRLRFIQPIQRSDEEMLVVPDDPGNGLLLWIERPKSADSR